MKFRFVSVTAVVVATLVGCQTDHSGADLSGLNRFTIKDGITTEVEVEHRLGPPSESSYQPDGLRQLFWHDSRKEVFLLHVKISNRHFYVTVHQGVVVSHHDTTEFPVNMW
jgi:hypothetical protein